MKIFLTRIVLVLLALSAPMFVVGDRLIYEPVFLLWNWASAWLYYPHSTIAPASAIMVLRTVVQAFVFPLLFAGWFAYCDLVRKDVAAVRLRSKVVVHFMIACLSFLVLYVVLAVSNAAMGPVVVLGSGDPFFYESPVPSLFGVTFVLLLVELGTYAVASLLRRRRAVKRVSLAK